MHACMLKAASRISSACGLARTWCLGTLCLLLVFSVSASDRSPAGRCARYICIKHAGIWGIFNRFLQNLQYRFPTRAMNVIAIIFSWGFPNAEQSANCFIHSKMTYDQDILCIIEFGAQILQHRKEKSTAQLSVSIEWLRFHPQSSKIEPLCVA